MVLYPHYSGLRLLLGGFRDQFFSNFCSLKSQASQGDDIQNIGGLFLSVVHHFAPWHPSCFQTGSQFTIRFDSEFWTTRRAHRALRRLLHDDPLLHFHRIQYFHF